MSGGWGSNRGASNGSGPDPAPKPHLVLLVEDHELVRNSIMRLFRRSYGTTVFAEAERADEAHRLALELRPELVIMDLRLYADDCGLETARRILADLPSARCVLLTGLDLDAQLIAEAASVGICGIIEKASDVRQMVEDFGRYFGLVPVVDERPTLTPRQQAVLQKLTEGQDTGDIAQTLGMNESTVRGHLRDLIALFRVRNRVQLALQAHSFFDEDR